MNAAARLQAAAEPGEVLVGETTFALTATSVAYRERRGVRAKGFDAPLVAFPVEALSTRSARRTIPFVGRAGELTSCATAWVARRTQGQPVLVTVLGGPGIGKSRLADEFIAGAR